MKLLCSIMILSLMGTGTGMSRNKCSPSDIAVKQKRTGTLVKGRPEIEVSVFNACPCPVGGVTLTCNGFQTAEKIDPTVLVVSAGGQCYLPKGSFIAPFSGYVFTYAWDYEFQFKVEPNGATCVQGG